jgi:hypothetical protein
LPIPPSFGNTSFYHKAIRILLPGGQNPQNLPIILYQNNRPLSRKTSGKISFSGYFLPSGRASCDQVARPSLRLRSGQAWPCFHGLHRKPSPREKPVPHRRLQRKKPGCVICAFHSGRRPHALPGRKDRISWSLGRISHSPGSRAGKIVLQMPNIRVIFSAG